MEKSGDIENKQVQKYKCVFSDSHYNTGAKNNAKNTRGRNAKSNLTNKKCKERRKIKQETITHTNRGEPKTYKKPLKQRTLK